MKKKFVLQKEIKKLLLSESYYVKYNRKFKNNIFEENYHGKIIDPDGKKRNLKLEKNHKLKQIKEVLKYLKEEKPGKILDIGCGHGWLLSTLSNKWNKFGLDISKFAAKSASKYGKIFLGDIKNFKEKNFDYVTALHVIEHHPNPSSFLKKIFNILKPGGILVIETPDFDSAAARRFGNKFRLLKDKTHISLFSQDSLLRCLRDFKFKIIDINYPFFETPFFNKKNILRIFDKNKISPPFYGSVITVYCRKEKK